MIKSTPTEFEIYDTDLKELIAIVKTVDECAAEVKIKEATNYQEWSQVSSLIGDALKAMELVGDVY